MLVDILHQLINPHVLQAFDDKLMVIKETYQYLNFRIFVNAKGGYFLSLANYVGFKHQIVLQVLIFGLLGLYEVGIVDTITFFV